MNIRVLTFFDDSVPDRLVVRCHSRALELGALDAPNREVYVLIASAVFGLYELPLSGAAADRLFSMDPDLRLLRLADMRDDLEERLFEQWSCSSGVCH